MKGAESPEHTILVVDDEPAIRLLCRVNLELDGYRVLEAGSEVDARTQLDAERVDAVLLDLRLGGGHSGGLLDEILARRPRIPVALVTGSPDLAVRDEGGADALLGKPFDVDELRAVVRALTTPLL